MFDEAGRSIVVSVLQSLLQAASPFEIVDTEHDSYSSEAVMEILVERLDAKLREWRPDIAELVKRRIAEIIDLADQDVLDILRSRTVEQEVLDLLDESSTQ